MFARLSNPTNPAAALAEITPGNISWIIGDACPSTPMPAVTFMHSTTHSSQNCTVPTAWRAFRFTLDTDVAARDTGALVGCQSGRGTRTVKIPNIMNAKYIAP